MCFQLRHVKKKVVMVIVETLTSSLDSPIRSLVDYLQY